MPMESRSREDRILEVVHESNELSKQRGKLLAKLRPVNEQLARLRKELVTLLKEGKDASG